MASVAEIRDGGDAKSIPVTKPNKVRLPRNIPAYKDAKEHEHQEGRTIVVCLDGTGDRFDNDNSNIVSLVSCLKKSSKKQITYYQAGIGTYSRTGLQSGFSAAMDMAIGSELGMHVRDAYHFLMHTYKEGDKICLFGFSRGAYTARCVAGMVHKVGLLPPRNIAQIPFAYDFYKDDSVNGWKMSADFKKTFCINVNIYFVGVFDSVASVGFIPRTLPLSTTPTNKPRYFRHALALDERRAKFKPCRYQYKDFSKPENQKYVQGRKEHSSKSGIEPSEPPFDCDVSEVWFAGAHADTYALAEHGLDIHTLYPIYRNLKVPRHEPTPVMLEAYRTGLPPKSARSAQLIPIDHTSRGDGHYDLKVAELEGDENKHEWYPEQMEDWFDAQAALNDQLEVARNWWILEYYPVEYMELNAKNEWETQFGMNLGRYRGVLDKAPKMHWTVAARVKNTDYEVRARQAKDAIWHEIA